MTDDPVTDYANEVLSGKIPACKLIKQACQRHLDDLERDDLFFDLSEVQSVIWFISSCCHIEGDLAGTPIILEPPQVFIVGCIFGWLYRKTKRRRFRTAYIEIPRKNGKSTLLAPIGLYMLCMDYEEGSQVYCAATKERQAKIVWDLAKKMVHKSKELRKMIRAFHNTLIHGASNSKFLPLGADSHTEDGLNPHCVIFDELHAQQNRNLWDVLEDAFGARSQPLMLAITTAGTNRDGICYHQRQHCVNFLDPESDITDDRYFAFIATLDDEDMDVDGWQFDKENWIKSNPMLEAPGRNASKRMDWMEDQAAKAKAMPSKEFAFMNKQLNIWTDGETKWIDMAKWDKCKGEIDTDLLKGSECYVGIDLSSKYDITAMVLLFPPSAYDKWVVLPFFYIPKDNIREKIKMDKVPYDQWVEKGLVTATDGDLVDLDFLKHDFLSIGKSYQILEAGYDPWKGTELATSLENEGYEMVLMNQGHKTLFPGTDSLETKIHKGEIMHDGNPVLRWMIKNTTLRFDPNGNGIPDKKNSYSRIDGVSALVNAMGRAIVAGADEKSIYDEQGITFL